MDHQTNTDSSTPAKTNPYALPDSERFGNTGYQSGQYHGDTIEKPKALVTIAIILIVFGASGVLGGLMSMVALIVMSQLNMNVVFGNNPVINAMKGLEPIQYSLFGFGLVISTLMLAGGIGLLKKSKWSLSLSSSTCLVGAVYKFLEIVFQIYVQRFVSDAMIDQMIKSNPKAPMAPEVFKNIVFYSSIAGVLIFSVPILILYFWMSYYLRSEIVKRYFGVVESRP